MWTVVKDIYNKLWIYFTCFLLLPMLSSIQWYVTSTRGLLLYPYFHLFTLLMSTELGPVKILLYTQNIFRLKFPRNYSFCWTKYQFFSDYTMWFDSSSNKFFLVIFKDISKIFFPVSFRSYHCLFWTLLGSLLCSMFKAMAG